MKYRLAYRFEPGQVLAFDVKQQSEMKTQLDAVSEEQTNSAEFRRHFKVVAVNKDGSADLETTIDWVRMKVNFSKDEENAIVFKSDDPKFHHPKFKHLLGSFGKPQAVVRVNAVGQTLKVMPTENANRDALVFVPDDAATPGGQTLSPEGYLMRLPDTELAVGESWTERCEIRVKEGKLPIRIDLRRTCKLLKVENGIATLQFRVSVITPGTSGAVKAQLIQREPTGQFMFDLKRGVVIATETAVDGTVIGLFDGKGSMQAISSFKERLITPEELAAKPSESTIR